MEEEAAEDEEEGEEGEEVVEKSAFTTIMSALS
jgi:hypothetical protein